MVTGVISGSRPRWRRDRRWERGDSRWRLEASWRSGSDEPEEDPLLAELLRWSFGSAKGSSLVSGSRSRGAGINVNVGLPRLSEASGSDIEDFDVGKI